MTARWHRRRRSSATVRTLSRSTGVVVVVMVLLPSLAHNHFLLGLASDARRPCLSQGVLSRGVVGRLFGLPVSAVGRRSFGQGPVWGLFGLYPFRPPFRPIARPEFRPGRRGAGGRSDARTWPIRELGGVAGDPLHWPLPRARTAAATGAGPQSRAAHESPPQTAPRPRAATGVAARPAPQTPSFLCNGPVVRGAAAHDGRDAARVSGRNGQVQL